MNTRPMIVPPSWRRLARYGALVGVAVSGVGLFSQASSALPAGTAAAGTMTMNPATGDSASTFSLVFGAPPAPQFCPGDNTASYLWHTFITPATNDPAPMTFTNSGTANGPPFTNNLANSIGTRSRNNLPGLGDGLVVAPTGLTFTNALYSGVTPGDYWIGIACTLPDNTDGSVNTMKYWAGRITVTASVGAGPNNFTFAASTVATTTTTSTTTTSTSTTSTSTTSTTALPTTVPGGTATTTTVAGATTTTVPCPSGATTTTTTLVGATTTAATTTTVPCVTATTTTSPTTSSNTTTTVRASSSGASNQTGSSQSIANTGSSSSTPWMIVWGMLLIVFGRMVILLGRPIRVLSDRL